MARLKKTLSEGQGEHSWRVRESSLGESGRVLSEGQGEFSRRFRESSLRGSVNSVESLFSIKPSK